MIREPLVAGQFYPADPTSLREQIGAFLLRSDSTLRAKGIVGPHAGYMYSGSVAGALYGAVEIPRRLVIMGPNHTGSGAPMALYPSGQWRTPLGPARIDQELNASLLAECPLLEEDHRAHNGEHSIEVHIPFVQDVRSEFRFSAICVGTTEYAALESLGHALSRAVKSSNEPVLLISSSDMTHYESASSASRKDRLAIDKVIAVDPPGLYRVVAERRISMCGVAPTVALLTACGDLGATGGKLIRYATSGDVSGDYDHVVGYAGIAVL